MQNPCSGFLWEAFLVNSRPVMAAPALLSVLATPLRIKNDNHTPTIIPWAFQAKPLRNNNVYNQPCTMMFANGREHAALPMALSDHMPPRCTTQTATDNPPHREATGDRTAEGRMRPSKHNDASSISTTTQGCMHTHNDVRTREGNGIPIGCSARRLWRQDK